MLGIVPLEEADLSHAFHILETVLFAGLWGAAAGTVGRDGVHGTNWGSPNLTRWVAVGHL